MFMPFVLMGILGRVKPNFGNIFRLAGKALEACVYPVDIIVFFL
jgi:hypothetical protein